MRASCSTTVASFFGVITVALLNVPAEAATTILGARTQAWYRDRDGLNIRFFSEPATDSVYPAFVGAYDDPDFGIFNYNAYFAFDVGSLTPQVTGAILRLPVKQYFSSNTTETIAVFDVGASVEDIVNTPFSLANYEDLGSGVEYGRQTVSVDAPLSDDADTILLSFIEVPLSEAAVFAINQAIRGSRQFALGVTLASLDGSPFIFSTGAEATEGLSFSDGRREYPQFPDREEELTDYEIAAELVFQIPAPEDPTAIPESSSTVGLGLLSLGFVAKRLWKRR
jgi:hypothetical protein